MSLFLSDNDRGSRDEEQPRSVAARVAAPHGRRIGGEADGEAAREQGRDSIEKLESQLTFQLSFLILHSTKKLN